jgi:hypothetical protein
LLPEEDPLLDPPELLDELEVVDVSFLHEKSIVAIAKSKIEFFIVLKFYSRKYKLSKRLLKRIRYCY